MIDPSVPVKKVARTFNLQEMMDQARLGAQERSKVDWTNEIEKAKEENETRIAEMKLKAVEATRQMQISTNSNRIDKVDDEEDFGPSIELATTAPITNDEDISSDDEANDLSKVNQKVFFLHFLLIRIELEIKMYMSAR